jgi:hypothetical protein
VDVAIDQGRGASIECIECKRDNPKYNSGATDL